MVTSVIASRASRGRTTGRHFLPSGSRSSFYSPLFTNSGVGHVPDPCPTPLPKVSDLRVAEEVDDHFLWREREGWIVTGGAAVARTDLGRIDLLRQQASVSHA